MAESKIEEVERAIRDNIQAGLPDGVSVDYRYAARAAIEAMREPSTEMQRAVSAQWGRRTWAQYEEVIDAALNEEVAG